MNNYYTKEVLYHAWGKTPELKKRESDYNRQYYQRNKHKWGVTSSSSETENPYLWVLKKVKEVSVSTAKKVGEAFSKLNIVKQAKVKLKEINSTRNYLVKEGLEYVKKHFVF